MATMPVGNLIGGKLATDLPLPVQSPQIAPNLVDPIRSDGLLAQSAVASSVTGTTTETVLATIAVPAGAMGVNGSVRVTAEFSHTNSANSKTLKILLAGNAFYQAVTSTTASMSCQARLYNRGVANSQISGAQTVGSGGFGSTGTAAITRTIDTTQAQNITITGTLANSGETITLEAYAVEILNP